MAIKSDVLLEAGTNELEIVEFILKYKNEEGDESNQYFGINVAKVREIIRMPLLTKMPGMPKIVCGVFNLRDSLIPALDLCHYLYGYPGENENNKMIIAEFSKLRVGFIVNDVYRIHRISWNDIVTPDALEGLDNYYPSIIGIIKFNDRNILMLDIEKIIAEVEPEATLDLNATIKKMENKPIAITAEDSSVIRKIITDRLNIAGFEIFSFNNGKDAWAKLLEISEKVADGEDLSKFVNVVITDIEMPQMDGYTLTKMIKSDSRLSKIPVIIFSSIISADMMHKGASVGADAQLTKPQIGELLETIRILLERTHG